jgi:hypothetical protein
MTASVLFQGLSGSINAANNVLIYSKFDWAGVICPTWDASYEPLTVRVDGAVGGIIALEVNRVVHIVLRELDGIR